MPCLLSLSQSVLPQSTSDSLLNVLQTVDSDTAKARLYLKLVDETEDELLVKKYNHEALRIAEKNIPAAKGDLLKTFLIIKSEALNNSGFVLETQGYLDSAVYYYEQSLAINEQLQNYAAIGSLLNNIAGVHESKGNIPLALEIYDNALKMHEKAKNKTGIAQVLNNIGYIYSTQNDLDKALEHYENSYRLKKELGNKEAYPVALINIGYIHDMKNDKFKAMSYYMLALKEARDLNDKEHMALAYNNMGGIYKDRGEMDEALKCFRNGLSLSRSVNEKDGIAHYLYSIGAVYLILNKKDSALYYAKQSYKEAVELGAPQKISIAAELLKNCYRELGDYKNAFDYYEIYLKMHDSITSESAKRSMYKQQLKYDYEKKALADSIRSTEEKKVIEAKLNQEKVQRYTLYGGLVLTLIFGTFMYNRFRITKKQKMIIEEQKTIVEKQKHLVEEKQKEILDSIHYAKRIQQSLLPTEKYIEKNLK